MRLLVIILLFSHGATAGEVTEFKPRPAVVDEGSDTYVGILLSEAEFRKLLQNKIATNAKIAECSVDRKVCAKTEGSYKYYISQLEAKIKQDNTWFVRNKGTLGILSGLVIGVGTSVAIVKAVYQGQ
tara:strand:+ start:1305 stop:1685 length:381 start_codon:yes stop_codon:yes gene_type:complete